MSAQEASPATAIPREYLFEILDEDENLLVINKSGDLVCHPTKGDAYSSLIGRLRLYFADQPEIHPSFINRLDRETSGVILIAKNAKTHASLQKVFQQDGVEKIYLAIVHGTPKDKEGIIDQPLGREPNCIVTIKQNIIPDGAPSITHWKLLKSTSEFSLLEVRPKTGRLHQIRVHLSSIGHPLVGDKLYGANPSFYLDFVQHGWTPELQKHLPTSRQMLHAAELKVNHPEPQALLHWKAPIPSDMQGFLKKYQLI